MAAKKIAVGTRIVPLAKEIGANVSPVAKGARRIAKGAAP